MVKKAAKKKAAKKKTAKRAAKKAAGRKRASKPAGGDNRPEPGGDSGGGLVSVPVERVPLSKINPAPYNPSIPVQPGDPGYEKLAKSIRRFGQVQPLVWNKQTGNLVGGHQALIVITREWPETEAVDCRVVELDPVAEKTLNIRLNQRATSDDPVRLGEALQELIDSDIDQELTGLDESAINQQIANMEAELSARDTPEPGSSGHSADDEPGDGKKPQQTGIDDEANQGGGDQSGEIKDTYKIVVTCSNEQDQQALLGRLETEGYDCRALIA